MRSWGRRRSQDAGAGAVDTRRQPPHGGPRPDARRSPTGARPRPTLPLGTEGVALLEVMVAAVILLIVFFGLAQFYTRGRAQIDYEEDRRRATAVLQARLDGIRSDYRYDDLATLSGQDTVFTIEDKAYRVHHEVAIGAPEAQATTLDLTVTWTARVGSSLVNRSMVTTTFLGRGMP